ncbi:beta-alanyl-bioamine nonribosomal peptide synthetase ebony-like [Macrobrachium nipponense]|uniref:beta-alanyl-bioamine nonribosomal peptide synthetase ebony-like n=1 Tax=Macrobrachium nipponense TaxID=159736 RepID=UPI0030C8139A
MAVLLGVPNPLPDDLTLGYEVFKNLATDEKTKESVALLSDNLQMTYSELRNLVDSLEAWILEVVDTTLKKESQKLANYEAYLKENEGYGMNDDEVDVNAAGGNTTDRGKSVQNGKDTTDCESKASSADQSFEAAKVGKVFCIALCMHRSPNLVALILAIWKLGWAFVPLDPAVPGVRTLFVLRDAEPACIITDEHTNMKVRSLESDTSIHPSSDKSGTTTNDSSGTSEVLKYCVSDRIVDIRTWENSSAETREKWMERSPALHYELEGPGKLACLMYTSGSTGNPKGVLLTMKNLMHRLYWQWNEFPFKSDEVCLMSKSLTFVDSLTELFTPLLAGVPVAIVKELHINPEIIINYVGKYGVTRLVLVPSLLKLLILYLNTTKDSIRLLQMYLNLWVSSGEPIPGWLLNDFFAMFPGSNFVNFYGSTEVTGDVTYLKIEETTWKAGVKVPIGKPVFNTALVVVKKNGQSYSCAKADEAGEIAIIGHNVCAGYHHGKQYAPDTSIFIPVSSIEFSDEKARNNLHEFLRKIYRNDRTDARLCDGCEHSRVKESESVQTVNEARVPTRNDVCESDSNHNTSEVSSPKKSPAKTSENQITSLFKSAFSPSKTRQSPNKTLPNNAQTSPLKSGQTCNEVCSLRELSLRTSLSLTKEDSLPENEGSSLTKTEMAGECTEICDVESSRFLENVVAYRTGDWGKVVGKHVIFEGRKDSQVKVRGVRVQLAEVDDAVHRSGYTDAHYVLAATEQDTEDEDHVLVAFVVLKPEFEERDTPITEDLLRCLRSYLPEVMVPRVVVLDTLPHLPSGKVDRQSLLKIYRKRMSHRSSKDNILILRKDEPIESRVLRIICGALGLARSQDVMNQNFFALGGSSITSVSVVVRLRDLGLDVTLEAFLKANTIGEVVNDILKAKTMAEVMNFFCPSVPGLPSSSASSSSSQVKKVEEELEEEEDEDPLCDLSIPAFHPDIPVCTSNKGQSKKPRGLRLALLHTQPLSQGVDKHTVIEILAESFTTKNPLDVAVGVPKAAHRCLLNTLWPRLVQDDLSFVVKDPQRGILGAVINTDFFNEPQIRVPPSMREIAALHETLEEEARYTLKQEKRGQRWVHNLFLATNNCLSAQDNVRLVLHLEKELLRVSQTRQYHGVFTVNSNPLNQMLCENYLGYRRRGTVRVASFWYEGRQPFGRLPHDLLLVAMIKSL